MSSSSNATPFDPDLHAQNSIQTIQEAIAKRLGYPPAAVEFVFEAMSYSVWYRFEPLDMSRPSDEQHCSAIDVCRSVHEHASMKFGMFAQKTLEDWSLLMPSDVGRIIYALVEEELIRAEVGDSELQFQIDVPLMDARWGENQNPQGLNMSRPDPVGRHRQIERRSNAIELCIFVAAFLYLLLTSLQGLPLWFSWWLLPLAVLGGILVSLSILRSLLTSRLNRALVEQNYLICPICEYGLNGLPTKGECPECGHPYVLGPLQRSWLRLQAEQKRGALGQLFGTK